MNRSLMTALIGAGMVLLGTVQAQACAPSATTFKVPTGREYEILNSVFSGVDLSESGDCKLTRDSRTGLDWLDITATFDQSYNSVAAGFGGYTTTQGFRFATRSEVETLFADGIVQARLLNDPQPGVEQAIPKGTIGSLSQLGSLGYYTRTGPGGAELLGYGRYGSIDPVTGRVALGRYGSTSASRPVFPAFPGYSAEVDLTSLLANEVDLPVAAGVVKSGSFLVRSSNVQAVPTPSLLPGMLGLMAAMRKRLKPDGLKADGLKPDGLTSEA
jgi:hypothetical protein